MRLAPRTEVRVIPDLLHARDEHLGRDTEFPAARGYEGARVTPGRASPPDASLANLRAEHHGVGVAPSYRCKFARGSGSRG